ncbi:Toll/interleukin-1 receptor domain-containing protein [Tanacetum coccineum]
MKGLANMKELRFLRMDTLDVSEDEVSNWNLPNTLRFLRWGHYPCSSLPKTFQANNLVGLHMHGGKMVQLRDKGEEKPFPKLRFLKFANSWLLRTLDLSVAPNLETLILDGCDNLVEVHFQVTPNLKELHIHNCRRLERLHMPAESPKLRYLDLDFLKLRTLHLGITPNLETLRVKHCDDMVELCMADECPKLVTLDLFILKLTTLHLGVTPNLETLSIKYCTDMVELRMPTECPKLVTLDLLMLNLTTLHLGITPNLKTLSLQACHALISLRIPKDIGRLDCLKELDITGTSCMRILPQCIFKMKGLRIDGSSKLVLDKHSARGFTLSPLVLVVIASGRIDVIFAMKNRKIHYRSDHLIVLIKLEFNLRPQRFGFSLQLKIKVQGDTPRNQVCNTSSILLNQGIVINFDFFIMAKYVHG